MGEQDAMAIIIATKSVTLGDIYDGNFDDASINIKDINFFDVEIKLPDDVEGDKTVKLDGTNRFELGIRPDTLLTFTKKFKPTTNE